MRSTCNHREQVSSLLKSLRKHQTRSRNVESISPRGDQGESLKSQQATQVTTHMFAPTCLRLLNSPTPTRCTYSIQLALLHSPTPTQCTYSYSIHLLPLDLPTRFTSSIHLLPLNLPTQFTYAYSIHLLPRNVPTPTPCTYSHWIHLLPLNVPTQFTYSIDYTRCLDTPFTTQHHKLSLRPRVLHKFSCVHT